MVMPTCPGLTLRHSELVMFQHRIYASPGFSHPQHRGRRDRKFWKGNKAKPVAIASQGSRDDLQGRTVVIIGLGRSGRAAAHLALVRGAASVIGLDKNPHVLRLEEDATFSGFARDRVRTQTGAHQAATLEQACIMVLSPGVPLSQPQIAEALRQGIPAVSELAFAAECLPQDLPIAAVSGTNGKSTVTTFTGQFLESAGLHTFVGGNLGTPFSEAALACLAAPPGSCPYQAAVVEVSSYQMELPGLFKPKAAVILNLTPDHLERHKSMEAYGEHKCRMFARMEAADLAVIPQDNALLRQLANRAGGGGTRAWLGGLPGVQVDALSRRAILSVPTTGAEAMLYLTSLKAVGAHNAKNAATAALLALGLDVGVNESHLQEAVATLHPLPHRMEVVCTDELKRVWINDSKATNVEATAVALQGLGGRKAVVLLGGVAKAGSDGKSLGFERLLTLLNAHRAVITFGSSGSSVYEELRDGGLTIPLLCAHTMADAVEVARSQALAGDVVLLSPSCASFDEFSNFEHRGETFKILVLHGST